MAKKKVVKIKVPDRVEDTIPFLDGVREGMKVSCDDRLSEVFAKQREFMDVLREHDILPEYPVDLKTKPGQRLIREMLLNVIEELMEASFCLRNKVHKITDDRTLDFDHYKEELGDALAYFVEVCVLSGIDADALYEEYVRKNAAVKKRVEDGY